MCVSDAGSHIEFILEIFVSYCMHDAYSRRYTDLVGAADTPRNYHDHLHILDTAFYGVFFFTSERPPATYRNSGPKTRNKTAEDPLLQEQNPGRI